MNKIIRPIICILTALTLILPSTLCMAQTETAIISVERVIADKDELDGTVMVELSITNNPGIAGLQFQLTYDGGIELTKVEKGEALPDLDLTTAKTLESPVNIGLDGLDEDSSNGVFAILTFTVPETVSSYSLNISIEPEDIYDFDLENVPVKIENGFIVIDTAAPDVDEDGEITPKDILATENVIAGNDDSDVVVSAVDFDGDNSITTKDLNSFIALIRRILELLS